MIRSGDGDLKLNLPPGFRFKPSDEELVIHYLCKKAASQPIIRELDIYKLDPWDLPEKALFGEKECYFLTPRDRKYPNGHRPNRAARCGYWKATGVDKPIFESGKKVGLKKSLVFYKGKSPNGEKTNWFMHEYRLPEVDTPITNKNKSLRMDDCVLCRIYQRKTSKQDDHPSRMEDNHQVSLSSSSSSSSWFSQECAKEVGGVEALSQDTQHESYNAHDVHASKGDNIFSSMENVDMSCLFNDNPMSISSIPRDDSCSMPNLDMSLFDFDALPSPFGLVDDSFLASFRGGETIFSDYRPLI